jgi:hypothetical protein
LEELMSDELELMKQAFEAKHRAKSLDEIQQQKQDFTKSLAQPSADVAEDVVSALAYINIRYRDPISGQDLTATVPSRVLMKTDERMLVWNVATSTLGMPWNSAPPAAREEAYAIAICRVQWDREKDVPEWFKHAYLNDAELAETLALEVGAHADLYFRGNRATREEDARPRFMVGRAAVPAAATGL